MVVIQELSDYIGEEIADARKYIEKALLYKDKYPELSKRYYTTSLGEMEHMKGYHEEIVKLIEDYRKTNGEPPVPMMAVYEHEHKIHIAAAGEVKALQAMYKEG